MDLPANGWEDRSGGENTNIPHIFAWDNPMDRAGTKSVDHTLGSQRVKHNWACIHNQSHIAKEKLIVEIEICVSGGMDDI